MAKLKPRLAILGLAGYGGYALWDRYLRQLGGRVGNERLGHAATPERRTYESFALTVLGPEGGQGRSAFKGKP